MLKFIKEKRVFIVVLFFVVTMLFIFSENIKAGWSTLVHFEHGGDELTVEPGGLITVDSTGVINVAPGGLFQYNSTDVQLEALTDLGTTELGYLNNVTAGVAAASKAVVLDTGGAINELKIDTLYITDTAVTATAAEVNWNDGSTVGVAVASKTAVLGASKDLDTLGVGNFKVIANADFNTASLTYDTGNIWAGKITFGTTAATTTQIAGLDTTDLVFVSGPTETAGAYGYVITGDSLIVTYETAFTGLVDFFVVRR